MIQNKKKKQKMYKRQSPDAGMFSEEELARLIEQVEEHQMLHAPAHLKENVLCQVRKQRRTAQKLQLFSYRAKVLTGMAAALAVLFLVPVGERETNPVSDSNTKQVSWQEDVDEIQKEALERQEKIEQTWQKYQEEQEKAEAREAYFNDIEHRIRGLAQRIF